MPGTRLDSGLVVLLDRFGTNVMTFIDPYSGRVRDQLPVGTGFESNPQDYVEALDKGFVARFGQNTEPGREGFDDGGDLLVLDLSPPRIRGQVLLPVWDELPARPTALARIGDDLVVSLARISLDFRTTGHAALVGVSAEDEAVTVRTRTRLQELRTSDPVAPTVGALLSLAAARSNPTGQVEALEESGIVVFSTAMSPPELVDELPAAELGEGPVQADVAFLSDDLVLIKTQTPVDTAQNNRLLAVDLVGRRSTQILEAAPDAAATAKASSTAASPVPGRVPACACSPMPIATCCSGSN